MINREKEIYKVTLIGGAVNVALLIFKFIAGIVGHSSAMIADAIHSLSDFATDVIVIVFVNISGKPQDKDHDYGHGKYETLATTIIGGALGAVAIGILYSGIEKIVLWANGEQLQSPGTFALWAAVVSIVTKEMIYQYTARKSRELDSPAVNANAWHHRSDALSSLGTAVGIGGAILLGERWAVLDAVASVVVGIFIVKVAYSLIKDGVKELTESSLSDEIENEILSIVTSYPDIVEPHHLRTRRIGSSYAIEMHIRMDGNISLTAAHSRATDIEKSLKERFGEKTHIAIHVEPVKTTCNQQ